GKTIKGGFLGTNKHQDPSMNFVVETIGLDEFEAPGDSGAPVMDVEGRVIGLVNYGLSGLDNINFGVSQHVMQPIVEDFIAADRILREEDSESKKRRSNVGRKRYVSREAEDDGDEDLPEHVVVNTQQAVTHLRYQKA